jgi:hypothetical protein
LKFSEFFVPEAIVDNPSTLRAVGFVLERHRQGDFEGSPVSAWKMTAPRRDGSGVTLNDLLRKRQPQPSPPTPFRCEERFEEARKMVRCHSMSIIRNKQLDLRSTFAQSK